MSLRFGSVCSGIEAASVAWEPLGWKAQWLSEIDPFPSAVLAHRFPGVPNYGDFTTIPNDAPPIDLLVGGTPCQSFSVAGLRKGMDDDRGNLALEFVRLAQRLRPRWVLWENVPGVLSSAGGRDFGSLFGALAQLGYGLGWRVLDAQYAGVPQRRRRVFLVGHLGDWRRAAAVLFEPESLCGDPRARYQAQEAPAGTLGALAAGGFRTTDLDGNAAYVVGGQAVPLGAHAFNAEGSSGLPFLTRSNIGKILNNQTPLIVETTAFHLKQDPISGDVSPALGRLSGGMGVMVRPVDLQNATFGQPDVIGTLDTTRPSRGGGQALMEQAPGAVIGDVRRLTPRECERLQGLPDDWTLVPYKGAPAKDSYRYKAIGNSMAVPVMRLLGARIEILERLGFCRSSVE